MNEDEHLHEHQAEDLLDWSYKAATDLDEEENEIERLISIDDHKQKLGIPVSTSAQSSADKKPGIFWLSS